MSKVISGTAHVFVRDDIDTDLIIPAKYLNTSRAEDLAPHALEALGNVELLKACDAVVVAGKNFGCGSSREHAVWALVGAGAKAVIAESFARIFFRNSINFGLPIVQLADATKLIRPGDKLEIDYAKSVVRNLTQKKEYAFEPLPEFLQAIVSAGGLLNQVTA